MHRFCVIVLIYFVNYCFFLDIKTERTAEMIIHENEFNNSAARNQGNNNFSKTNCSDLKDCVNKCTNKKLGTGLIQSLNFKGSYKQIIFPCEIECKNLDLCIINEK
jgi:hypothetical protein